jgi:hypothetical protein
VRRSLPLATAPAPYPTDFPIGVGAERYRGFPEYAPLPPGEARRLRILAQGLVSLGFTKAESEDVVDEAYRDLVSRAAAGREPGAGPPEPPTDDEILTEALRRG